MTDTQLLVALLVFAVIGVASGLALFAVFAWAIGKLSE